MSTLSEMKEKRHPRYKNKWLFLDVCLEGKEENQPMSSTALLKLLMIPALSSFGILSKGARAMLTEGINARDKLEMFQCFLWAATKKRKKSVWSFLPGAWRAEHSRAEPSRAEQPPLTRRFVPPLAFFSFPPQNHSSITFFPVSSKRARLVR